MTDPVEELARLGVLVPKIVHDVRGGPVAVLHILQGEIEERLRQGEPVDELVRNLGEQVTRAANILERVYGIAEGVWQPAEPARLDLLLPRLLDGARQAGEPWAQTASLSVDCEGLEAMVRPNHLVWLMRLMTERFGPKLRLYADTVTLPIPIASRTRVHVTLLAGTEAEPAEDAAPMMVNFFEASPADAAADDLVIHELARRMRARSELLGSIDQPVGVRVRFARVQGA